MPATLELLPRKEFKIILEDGNVISGKFGVWAAKAFCDKHKCSLPEMGVLLADNVTIDILLSYFSCAIKDQMPDFIFTERQLADWIDELGGIGSKAFESLINHAGSGDAEKKSDQANL